MNERKYKILFYTHKSLLYAVIFGLLIEQQQQHQTSGNLEAHVLDRHFITLPYIRMH